MYVSGMALVNGVWSPRVQRRRCISWRNV